MYYLSLNLYFFYYNITMFFIFLYIIFIYNLFSLSFSVQTYQKNVYYYYILEEVILKKRKIRLIKTLKLQSQFFIAYLLLSFFIIGFFSMFFYYYTSKILIKRETNSLLDISSTIKQQTDQVIKEMDTVSINIGYSNLAKDKLQSSFDIPYSSDDFVALTQLFVAINGTDTRADQICLYDFNGNCIRVGKTTNTTRVDLNSLTWYPKALELDGGKYIRLPYSSEDVLLYSSKPYYNISLYRTFHNRFGQKVGFIETTKNCKSIFKNILTYQKKNNNAPQFYVYDKEGNLVFPYDAEVSTVPFPEYDYFSEIDFHKKHVIFYPPDSSSSQLIAYDISAYTDWIYVSVQSEDEILSPVYHLLKIILLFSIIVFIFAILLSFATTKKLTKPLAQLKNILTGTKLDTLGQGKTLHINSSFDELTQLTSAFEQMSQNLKVSMDELLETRQQEMKSRSLALQSQINPHFYYNTLASIQVLSENQDHEKIKLMCKYLTSIMRYITHGNLSTVTLEAEINYVEKYLYCMKVRYQSSLNYEIQVPDELLGIEVPKLIIQPLVENALKYGNECNPPWNIYLIGSITSDGWQLQITDTGPGFRPEALERIKKRIQESSNKIGMPKIEINGMGLLNVYLRWKLHCQEDIIFEYGNNSNGHAFVIIGKKINGEGENNE